MTQLSSGNATMTPMAPPCTMTAVGNVRSSLGNHLYAECNATGAAGPSPAPSAILQATSVPNPAAPIMGNWVSAQTRPIATNTQRVCTRLTTKPVTTADNAKSR